MSHLLLCYWSCQIVVGNISVVLPICSANLEAYEQDTSSRRGCRMSGIQQNMLQVKDGLFNPQYF